MGAIMDRLDQTKASIRAKVEHPFRVIKRQFGHVKVRMSASKYSQRAAKRGEIGPQTDPVSRKPAPAEIECINSRCCGCCADGMDVSTCSAVDGVGP